LCNPAPIELATAHASRRVAFAPLRAFLAAVAKAENVEISNLSVVLADHDTVKGLNREHLGRTYATDVIAFDLRANPGDPSVDGEIYVDLDTAAERAPEFNVRFTDEVHRYAVHGLLHLVGYRDDSDGGRSEMKTLEDQYLKRFNAHRRGFTQGA
jgi:rRNA maturation RNase YbeY